MTHVARCKDLGIYGKDIIHNPKDKSYEGFFPEEDPYQISNFLDEKEIEICKKFYYDHQLKDGVQLGQNHFFLTYPLNYPELDEILRPKLNDLFGEWYSYSEINSDEVKQSSDFFFWQKGVFAPHVDSIIHIKNYIPYKDVLIPLEIDKDVESPYYSCHQRWYGRGTHFKYGKVDDMFAVYSNVLREKTYNNYEYFKYFEFDFDKMVNEDWYNEYFGEPEKYPFSIFTGLSINKHLNWIPGAAIINDSSVIHGATNYTLKGGDFKLGITLRIFKYNENYNPDPTYSAYPKLLGFKECTYDPRYDKTS